MEVEIQMIAWDVLGNQVVIHSSACVGIMDVINMANICGVG